MQCLCTIRLKHVNESYWSIRKCVFSTVMSSLMSSLLLFYSIFKVKVLKDNCSSKDKRRDKSIKKGEQQLKTRGALWWASLDIFFLIKRDLWIDQKAKVGTNVCFLSLITLKPEECLKNYLVKRYIAWLAFYPYKLPSGSPDQLPKIMFRIISILAWDVSAYAELTTHLMQMIHNHNRWFDHELVLNIYKKSKNQKLQVFQHFSLFSVVSKIIKL